MKNMNNDPEDISKIRKYSSQTSKPQSKRVRPSSTKINKEEDCRCTLFQPLFKFVQVFGIIPINYNRETCKMSHQWKSIPTIINGGWVFGNIITFLFAYSRIYKYLQSQLHGTTFYTNTISLTIQLLSTILLFIHGNLTAIKISKVWNKFHDTMIELNVESCSLIKYSIYLIPIHLFYEFIGSSFLIIGEASLNNWNLEFNKFLLGLAGFVVNLIPNLSSLTFALICYVISKNFGEINRQLVELRANYDDDQFNNEVQSVKNTNSELNMGYKLGRLRKLHEDLCETVRNLETAFGIQLIAIFVSTGISFVVGVYNLIMSFEYLSTETNLNFCLEVISNGLMPIYAGLRILLILCTCQNLVNNGNESGNILNNFNTDHASEETKEQVATFLKKVGMFPVKITALHVFELGHSVIGVGVGNVITYVLVLMQFRLDQPEDLNGTTAINNSAINN